MAMMLEPFADLLSIGKSEPDTFKHPRIDSSRSIGPEPGETTIYSGSHKISGLVYDEGKSAWITLWQCQTRAEVMITDRRVWYVVPRWKSEQFLGSTLERRIFTAMMERTEGKQLLAGHIRHQWPDAIYIAKPKSFLPNSSRIEISVQYGKATYRLAVNGFTAESCERVGRRLVEAVAKHRLDARQSELTDEEEATLSSWLECPSAGKELSWARRYSMPKGMKAWYDYPTVESHTE